MKKYIKLNNNPNHLSIGNLFNEIKKISKNKSSAIQTEIFCILFNIENISDTTVNNYCTGCRAIGNEYKQKYINLKKKYKINKNIMLEIINNLLSIIDGIIYNYQEINDINKNDELKKLCLNLHILAKNDLYVPINVKKEILEKIDNELYYEALCWMLFFIILEKKQPLYESDLINETIEEILNNTNISINNLKDYLKIQFNEGISHYQSLLKLANNNNPYAMYELGNMEYNGLITGNPHYEEAYKYHLQASTYNHPSAYWMLAHIILNKKIGNLEDDDITIAWNYLKKAQELNSISALNTIGICYLTGKNPQKETNKKLAISYFKKAADNKYVYAYNNLGKIYEEEKNYQKAFEYYLKAADENESWACNKIANYYKDGIFVKKDIKKAFEYYNLGINTIINNLCPWNIYNLVKYFYLYGNSIIGIEADLNKSITLLNSIKNFKEADELYLYIYYQKYLINQKKEDLLLVNKYLNSINNNLNITIINKKEIEKSLNNIKSEIIKLPK